MRRLNWQHLMRPSSLLALTIESHQVVAAQVKRENGGSRLVKSLTISLTPESIVGDPEQAGLTLGSALREAGIPDTRSVVCVPPSWALTASADLPDLDKEELAGYLELRAEQEFPLPPAELHLSHSIFERGADRHATLAALPGKRLQAVQRALEVAGYRPISISLGLDACLEGNRSSGGLNFIANGKHVDVVVCAGGGVAGLRSLTGSPRPLGDGVQLDESTLDREVRITLGRLPEDLRSQLHEARFLGPPEPAGALRDAIAQPLQRLGIRPRAPGEGTGHGMGAPRSGAAVAAVRRFLQGQPVTFEFIPPQVSRLRRLSNRLPVRGHRAALLLVAAVVVLTLAVLAGRGQYERHLSRKWASMEETVSELDGIKEQIRHFRPWFDRTAPSLSILETLTTAFPETGDVWVRTVEIEQNDLVTCTGFAGNQSAFMETRDRLLALDSIEDLQLEQQRGHDPIQFEFSFRWQGGRHE